MTDLSSWTAYFQDFGQFFNGFLFTLALAIGSFILAMVLGIFFGALSTSKHQILRILARIFVEFYQNTPSWCSLSSSSMVCLLSVTTPS